MAVKYEKEIRSSASKCNFNSARITFVLLSILIIPMLTDC